LTGVLTIVFAILSLVFAYLHVKEKTSSKKDLRRFDSEDKTQEHDYDLENKQLGIIEGFTSKIFDSMSERMKHISENFKELSQEVKIMCNITSNYLVKFKDTIEEIDKKMESVEKNIDLIKEKITKLEVNVEDIKQSTFECRGGGKYENDKKKT